MLGFTDLFTDDDIAANLFAFYLAVHETTAITLSFAFYELAMHPEIQDKLRQEITEAKRANNGVMDYTVVNNITYLEMVILGMKNVFKVIRLRLKSRRT